VALVVVAVLTAGTGMGAFSFVTIITRGLWVVMFLDGKLYCLLSAQVAYP